MWGEQAASKNARSSFSFIIYDLPVPIVHIGPLIAKVLDDPPLISLAKLGHLRTAVHIA